MTICDIRPAKSTSTVVGFCIALMLWATPAQTVRAVTTPTFRTVALTGVPAPGAEPGVLLSGLAIPVINKAGQTAFFSTVSGPNVGFFHNDRGIWSESSGSLTLVARAGSVAPGAGPDEVFQVLRSEIVLNDAGQVAFKGFLTGDSVDSSNDGGFWLQRDGTLALIAREGNAAPGAGPGVVFGTVGSFVLNDTGQLAISGSVAGTGVSTANDRGLWLESGGSLVMIAREGDPAPGAGNGITFQGLHTTPALNNAGQATFQAVFSDGERGIWLASGEALLLVAREGDAAPGAEPDEVFGGLHFGAVINSAGQFAFNGSILDASLLSSRGSAIWAGSPGSLELLGRTGDAAPGTEVEFASFFTSRPVLNNAGQAAFLATLSGAGIDGANDRGLWLASGGNLKMIAREGDPAPGVGPGVVFGDMPFSTMTSDPALNGAGQVAFWGALAGEGVDATNDKGIWTTDLSGELVLIVREGDLFDVDINPLVEELRTISDVRMVSQSGGEDGRARSFNDAGQLAFWMRFTDGTSGVFVATIPEPGTMAVLGIYGLGLLRRRI